MEEENEVVIVTNVYGDVCIRRKARRKRQKLLVKELLFDYANNTTLHGLPYITRRGLTNVEKVFWFITFVVSIGLCLFLISKVWFKWQTSPVIVSFSEQMVPVSMVPFPSVTICPQSKVKVSVYNFTDETVQLDEFLKTNKEALNATMRARFAKFDALFQICDKTFLYNDEFNLTEVYPTKHADSSMVKYMKEVYIQHPADLPQSSLYYYAMLHNQVSSMAIGFDVVNTSETLRYYDPEMMECLSNITYAHCHCVEFFMPHSSSKKICTGIDEECILEARDLMLLQESIRGNFTCHCLPSCIDVDYGAEILKTDFKLKKFINSLKKLHPNYSDDSFKNTSFSKIEMYFMKPRFLSMRRSELFGVTDFLANCGGLLGLFLGFSFLSLVEIFYFLTLRLCCTLKKDLEEEKAQDKVEHGKDVEKY
uniref:Uncharacterized protein n=1 Tax=Heliothis virescens TaxID=7102 RepID=A0A2A4IYE2_HELVI